MCGINGFNWADKETIARMNSKIEHRGPDDSGIYLDNNVTLGHQRLSILDLSEAGHQPMFYSKEFGACSEEYKKELMIKSNVGINFNGEIYNFPELKADLEKKGYIFSTRTDTEVILASYLEWGFDCVKRFNGMWAFCIYDKTKNILFLSRDRFGVKPLYYYFDKGKFIFSSELKAIQEHNLNLTINKKALNFYFYQGYIGDNLTIYNNCFKLKPSESLIFDLSKESIKIKKYYDLKEEIEKISKISLKKRVDSVKGILTDAIEKRLISDVPIGSFLSGGVDSSTISAIIAKKHKNFDTFSIGFKEKEYDESKYSKIVSDYIKTNHFYRILTLDENLIEEVIKNLDEPFGDSSIFPTYLVSKIAKEKVTVALSGDAGDEIFAGYDPYLAYKMIKYIPKILFFPLKIFSRALKGSSDKTDIKFKMSRFISGLSLNSNKSRLNWLAQIEESERRTILKENFIKNDALINIPKGHGLLTLQLLDMQNYLPGDILRKVDFASMLNSLEVRTPFLDYRLVPLVLSLPERYKIRLLRTKWLLKNIAKGLIPKEILKRKKKGFSVPLSKWVKESHLIKEFITKKEYFKHNLIDYDYTQNLFREHLGEENNNSRQLWLIFIFNYWYNKHFEKVNYDNEKIENPNELQNNLLITIDVEPDCDIHWNRSNPPTFDSVNYSIPKLLRPIWNKYNINPIYFVSPEVLIDIDSCKVLKEEIKNGAIIGAHLHSEYIEPNKTDIKGKPSEECPCYAHSTGIEFEKIKNLTILIQKNLGVKPIWYRAARFGADLDTIKSIKKLGYKYDSSVTPEIDWRNQGGPNHSMAPNQPYEISKEDFYKNAKSKEDFIGITEFPLTIFKKRLGFIGKLLPNKWFFYKWLRPTIMTTKGMKSLIKEFNKKYKEPTFVMMFHSMELIPNKSPYVRSKLMQRMFLKRLEKIIKYIQTKNGK